MSEKNRGGERKRVRNKRSAKRGMGGRGVRRKGRKDVLARKKKEKKDDGGRNENKITKGKLHKTVLNGGVSSPLGEIQQVL